MLLGWLGKRSLLRSTWRGCTHPSSLHVWRATRLSLSSLFKQTCTWSHCSRNSVTIASKLVLLSLFSFVPQLLYSVAAWTLTFPKWKHVIFWVHFRENYLFSDFRNYGNMLRAKIISKVSHLFQAMNVRPVFFLFRRALSSSNKQRWTK